MTPFHIDGEAKTPARRAPSIGQDNESVLREAGYTPDDVERLRGLGVIA
jgi:crotonobetainyl-CoA:carnitine CoA-transferase CaiB-like acyl-CoA transferase